MSGWLVFYHYGHEMCEEFKDYMRDLQHKVQKVSGEIFFFDFYFYFNFIVFACDKVFAIASI